jgi:hypothetical protein
MPIDSTLQRISVFLDTPGRVDKKSKVLIQFYSSDEFKDLAGALTYLKTQSPIPLLLRRKKKDEGTCVEVVSLNTPKMTFSFSPPSHNPEEDITEIFSWFQKNNIEVKLVS